MRATTGLKQLLDGSDAERKLGPFQLLRPLGRGGQAPVWLAREVYGETELRLAAIKLFALRSAEAQNGTHQTGTELHRSRVLDEAKALCRVEHPSISRFYSIASNDSGSLIGVAMEYLSGKSLEERLSSGSPLPVDEALTLGASIASALSAVHRAGIVHRDVKPANIVDSAGTAKLIDFGIAWEDLGEAALVPVVVDDLPLQLSAADKRQIQGAMTYRRAPSQRSSRSAATVTASTTSPMSARPVSGTVGYVDPACISGDASATALSDIYALGVVLFESLAGKHPAIVGANTGAGLRFDVLSGREPTPPLRSVVPGLPASLCALIDSMLAAEPSKRPQTADWVAIELERIRDEVAGARRALPSESVGPFRGLNRFEDEDRDVYFGRSCEIAAAIELLRTNGLVSLVGPSGSGKSSLARAGVLPRVRDGALGRGIAEWDIAVVSPGHDPRAAILAALSKIPSPLFGGDDDGSEWEPSRVVAALAARAQSGGRGALLFVDQMEELVTIAQAGESRVPSQSVQGASRWFSPEGTRDFAVYRPSVESTSQRWTAELLVALSQSSVAGVRALVTVRQDLLDPLLAFEGLGKAVVRGTLFVEPMTDSIWLTVLEQALAAYGYRLEDEALAEELLEQLRGTASAMPLVQFALTELWNKRDTAAKRITRAGLDAIGGIAGSLERHAETTFADLVRIDPHAEQSVREMLLALTTPQGTRTSAEASALTGGAEGRRKVLSALEQARLVVSTPEGVTLAHDSLLTQWRRLSGWLAEVREQRLLVEELERDAQRWAADPDGVALLWRKRRLATARELIADSKLALTKQADRFLHASGQAERRARGRAAAIALVMAGLLAVGATSYVRSLRASENAAIEREAAAIERAELEESKRIELEKAQALIEAAQTDVKLGEAKIRELMASRANATSPEESERIEREIAEEKKKTAAAVQRINAALPARPQVPHVNTATPAVTTTAAAPIGPKWQRDPE